MADALCSAAADGNVEMARGLIGRGTDVNCRSNEGFLPLCLAAFWGNADVVKILLKNGADVNGRNSGTRWTACHCAAFQGHGKVIMTLMEYNPKLELKDDSNRTAIDFASALDSIWPHFAVAGCRRTSKADLIRLKIVEKAAPSYSNTIPGLAEEKAYFSRPGSAYVMRTQQLHPSRSSFDNLQTQVELSDKAYVALNDGDVLTDTIHEKLHISDKHSGPKFSAWRT